MNIINIESFAFYGGVCRKYLANKKPKKLRGVCRKHLANKKPKKLSAKGGSHLPSFVCIGEIEKMPITCCFIKEQYFINNAHFAKMLDSGNTIKQSHRTHLCVQLTINNNTFYIPLRNNLGSAVRKFGRIGHSIPADNRPNAGLDYRYAIIVHDPDYIEIPSSQRIPNRQHQKILSDISTIQTEFEQYLTGFIKAAKKNRIDKEALYRESSLINFLEDLGV